MAEASFCVVVFFIKRRQIRLNKIRIDSARVRGSRVLELEGKDGRGVFLAVS